MTAILCDEAVSESTVDVALTTTAFQGWNPDVVVSRVVTFGIPEPRFVHGIPFAAPAARGLAKFVGELGGFSSTSGFLAPSAVNTLAKYRWLPDNFTTPTWSATAQTRESEPQLDLVQTWAMVARDETWDSAARTETWATLPVETVNPEIPVWTPIGSNPRKLSSYSYWRRDRYVANPAVGLDSGEGLLLSWSPSIPPSQMTVVMVVVPRAPLDAGYSLVEARSGAGVAIAAHLMADSSVRLTVGADQSRTIALSGRARPNEPIVVTLSTRFGPRPEVLLGIVDEQVRAISVDYTSALTFANTLWKLNAENDARMELLDVNVYLDAINEDSLIRLGHLFNRIYGVTFR